MIDFDRPDIDTYWMQVVHNIKERSTCLRAQHGSVLVDKLGRIIATGYNGAPPGHPHCYEADCILVEMDDQRTHCLRAIHGDMNAVWSAMMTGQATRMIGATMYASGHPCPRCLPILLSSGIKRIVYERYGYTNYDELSGEMQVVIEAFGADLEPFGVEHPLPLEEKRGSQPRKPTKHRK